MTVGVLQRTPRRGTQSIGPNREPVVHVCLDKEAALNELPALCSGDLNAPLASGIGTNASASSKQAPRAVILGGRLADEDFDEITSAINNKAPSVRVVRITRDDMVKAGIPVPPPGQGPPSGPPPGGPPPGGFPNAEVINKLMKDKLEGI